MLNASSWQFLFILLVASNLAVYHLSSSLVTDDLLYEELAKRLGSEVAAGEIENRGRVGFILLEYAGQVVWLLVSFFTIAFVITTGLNAFNVKASFTGVLRFLTPPFFIFIIPDLFKFIWFSFIEIDYSLQALNNFPGLSIADLFRFFDSKSPGGITEKLCNIVSVENLLFCYFFVRTAEFENTDPRIIYIATFSSFFVSLFCFRLLLHLFTSTVML